MSSHRQQGTRGGENKQHKGERTSTRTNAERANKFITRGSTTIINTSEEHLYYKGGAKILYPGGRALLENSGRGGQNTGGRYKQGAGATKGRTRQRSEN